jgi:RHS repeat-associated protein
MSAAMFNPLCQFNHIPSMNTGWLARSLYALLAVLLLAFAWPSFAQAPQFRSSSTMNGAGTIAFPAGSASTDWLVMSVISGTPVTTPTGWTAKASYAWTGSAYYSYVFTRQKGTDTSVTVSPVSGSVVIVAYQNTAGIGAIGTFSESAATANTLSLNSITPQNANSKVLGIVIDRDVAYPTPAAGFTSSAFLNSTYFSQNIAERPFRSTAPTGTQIWTQSTLNPYLAAGVLIELLPTSSTLAIAPAPQFRASSVIEGAGTLNFPVGSMSSDWLVMYVISTAPVTTPAGWTLSVSYTWTAYSYRSYVFTRQKGSDTTVTVDPASGSALIVAYQNTGGIGAVGTFSESSATANTLSLNSITPQSANSKVLGIVCDRDEVFPTPPSTGFTTSANYRSYYYGQNIGERAFGSTAATGPIVWTQSTYNPYPAAGVLIELLPAPMTVPTIAAAFNPDTIVTGGASTATFTLNNANFGSLTNAAFTGTLTNMSVAATPIGGTCTGVTNTPALMVGATALNLKVPSLPVGGCTITVSLKSSTAGIQPLTSSGVTTTQTPAAGAVSNTANLTVRSNPFPATITTAFTPAWIATGGTSTLSFALTSPSALALTNATFTDTLTNITVASTTIGGTCTGVTNTPALVVGATALNLKVPTLPASGCTVTLQVKSTVLGSNVNSASGVTSTQTTTAGAASNTAYLTVNPVNTLFSYVHADHLGTPRVITRPSDNKVVWEWRNDEPFGNNLPNENPSALGTFTYNLRLGGWQQYDKETGNFQNWNRDYDPAIGRYDQSDPLGLGGGMSTYGYVYGNPLAYFDDDGLKPLRGGNGGNARDRRGERRNKPKPAKPVPGGDNSLGDSAGYFNVDGEFVCLRWYCPQNPNQCSTNDTKSSTDFIPESTDAKNPPDGCVCDEPRYRLQNNRPNPDYNDFLQARQWWVQREQGSRLLRMLYPKG